MAANNRRIKFRRDTRESFEDSNPVLSSGEPSVAFRATRASNTYDSNQPFYKVGEGVNSWVDLPRFLTQHDVDSFKHTVTVPSVAANSTSVVTLAEAAKTYLNDGDEYAVFVAPAAALPAGITISYAYYDNTSSGSEINVVFANNSGSPSSSAPDTDIYVIFVQTTREDPTITTTPAPAISLAHEEMFTAGENIFGQLGLGDRTDRTILTRVSPYAGVYWTDIDAGYDHTVALSLSNKLYVAGSNYYGQLGLNQPTDTKEKTFTQVSGVYGASGIWDEDESFTHISAGSYHTAAINQSGELFACGNNGFGAVGDGTIVNKSKMTLVGTDDRKYRALPIDSGVTYDGAGNIYIEDANEVYMGPRGYVIVDSGTYTIKSPTYPFAILNAGLTSCSTASDIITYTGTVLDSTTTVDGHSYFFFTGDITIEYNGCPMPSSGIEVAIKDGSTIRRDFILHDKNRNGIWQDVSCGHYHTLGVSTDKRAYGWGHNYFGQIGAGTDNVAITPRKMEDTTDVERVVAGEYHSLILESAASVTGNVWAIGLNDRGQLGLNDLTNRTQFDPSELVMSGVKEATAGRKHTILISGDLAYAMGDNSYGQTSTDASFNMVPTALTVPNAEEAAAGAYHTIIRDTYFRLYAMGLNSKGQLGLSDNNNRSTPTIVNDQFDYINDPDTVFRFDSPAAGGNVSMALLYEFVPTLISNLAFSQHADYRVNPDPSISDNQDKIILTWDHDGLEQAVSTYKVVIWKKTGSGSSLPSNPKATSTGVTDNDYESDQIITHSPTDSEFAAGSFSTAQEDAANDIMLDEPTVAGTLEYIIYVYGVNNFGTGAAVKTSTISVVKT